MAIEMEGSGFASSCDKKKISWLVFRGISDYGDMKKRDKMQALTALHAALAAKTFLINVLDQATKFRSKPVWRLRRSIRLAVYPQCTPKGTSRFGRN
jgi:hypothetical protein